MKCIPLALTKGHASLFAQSLVAQSLSKSKMKNCEILTSCWTDHLTHLFVSNFLPLFIISYFILGQIFSLPYTELAAGPS